MQLRNYQTSSIDLIRYEFKRGFRRILLWLATGAGKTVIFCTMAKAASENGMKTIVVTRGRKLIDQASQRLFREGVHHGVKMAGHWNVRPGARVQVCSIDTLIARKDYPEADLIIIDEADLFTEDSQAGKFLEHYPNAFVVAVTATPWVKGGLGHLAQKVIHPITMQELIDQNHLTGFKYYAPKSADISEVKVSKMTNDFVAEELAETMITSKLSGNIVQHYLKYAQTDLPSLGFAVNIRHSKWLTERFNEAGIPAEHCDSDVKDKDRVEIIKRLESGETKIVFNVGIFCRGVDIPSVGTIVMARPTQSVNLYIQQAGRGTRNFNGKEYCVLLDHAGNIDRHGFPTMEDEVDLEKVAQEDKGTSKRVTICDECFCCYEGGGECPECGHKPERAERGGELSESDEELQEVDEVKVLSVQLVKEARKKGYKKSWAYYRLIDKVGYELAKPYVPQYIQNKFEGQDFFGASPFRAF